MSKITLMLMTLSAAVGVYLTSCSSYGNTMVAEEQCVSEACLMPKLLDFSVPAAQPYLQVRRSIIQGFKLEEASRSFRERYATAASFAGDYEVANRFYPLSSMNVAPSAQGYSKAAPANIIVRTLSRGNRAVFFNEAHAMIQTRAAIYTLLRPLREEGYNYLALEGLATFPAGNAKICADALLLDAELPARGYAINNTGFYTREPVFGEIIREALRLGFKLVAYESAFSSDRSIEGREQRQAENLACVFKDDPKARLLVIAGFGHAAKSPNGAVSGGMMAARFKSITGIDPLSVDTTKLLRARVGDFNFSSHAKEQYPSQGYVLSDAAQHLFSSADYDLMLLLPDTSGRNGPGASWLELDGARRKVPVSLDSCKDMWPCLIQAFPLAEVSGIPADSCVAGSHEDLCPLFLSKGTFRLKYFDSSFRELESLTISSSP